LNKAQTVSSSGDEWRIAKNATADTTVGSLSMTFTVGSTTVTNPGNITGSFAVGDWIGKTTAVGDGGFETFYRINAISYSDPTTTITLSRPYYGTTATVASVVKKFYQTCSGNDVVYTSASVYLNNKSITISGGWNLTGSPVQDGETWCKGAGANRTTTWYIFRFAGTGSANLSKFNLVETYSLDYISVGTRTNCTFSTYIHPFNGSTSATYGGTNTNHNYCAWQAEVNTNGLLSGTGANPVWTFNYILSNCQNFNFYVNASGAIFSLTNSVVIGGSSNIYFNMSGNANAVLTLTGTTTMYASSNGIVMSSTNAKIIDGTASYCVNGLTFPTDMGHDYYVKDLNTNNNTYGIYATRTFGLQITGGTSTSDTYGVYFNDQYGRNVRISGRTFVTPGTNAVYSSSTMSTTGIFGGSIDAPSVTKLFNDSTAPLNVPRILVDNVTNAVSGQYYGAFQLVKNTATYRTAPPCLAQTFKGATNYQYAPIKYFSTYVPASVTRTLSVYIKKDDTWTGTLVPVVTLNGKDIYTGATISSLTTSWVKYEYEITSGLITVDGELALCFIPQFTSTITVYFDDFEVV
jgi:hypothetical protein